MKFQHVCNDKNAFTVGQLMKRLFSGSAILIHDALQTTYPFTDAVTM